MMKIKEGYGMTRDGRKVKIERNGDDGDTYPFSHDSGNRSFHAITATGKSCIHSDQDDIISMIDDDASSPVRTVTRREIVKGVYGPIHVGGVDASSRSRALVALNAYTSMVHLTSSELRSASMVFSQLAEALDDMGEEE